MGRKTQEEKEFLISQRKKTGPGLTNAPVWIMQKAGKRIYNKKARKHWRETHFGQEFKKKLKEQGKIKNTKKPKSGHKNKSAKFKPKRFYNTRESK
jgi:ribosomal protein L39E